MTDQSTQTWLTQEAYDRLHEEYEDRTGPLRESIVNRIQAAREEGDLKENGGYHAAKDEQGKNEARVRQLQQLLENAAIGTPPASDGVVAQGRLVTVRFEGSDSDESFLLGSREEAKTASVDVYSPTSPLGAAVLDRKVGDVVSYDTPTGRTITATIVSTEPYAG
ncbi:MAG TPA: transcription elongation factor GreA [Candidatus Nanopelagicales bacterium]|nr:transcription elongation factor GreA [Candidatus Nanopelagicales bacterium]